MAFSNQPVKVPKLVGKSPEKELAYWNDVKASGDPSQLLVFITNFPEGTYVEPAVELYKQKCGDLTLLPPIVLTCKTDTKPPAPKPAIFLPPPKSSPPPVEYVPPVLHRHLPKPIVHPVGKGHRPPPCKNGNSTGAANCGEPPSDPFSGTHGPGGAGTQRGSFGNTGNTGGGTPGKP